MGEESLAQFAKGRNAEKMAARRQVGDSEGSQVIPTRKVPPEKTARETIVAEFVPEEQTEVMGANLIGQK
ncbi:hypothetical protein CsSME_00025839 [Camellia sinensis var. sinensis]